MPQSRRDRLALRSYLLAGLGSDLEPDPGRLRACAAALSTSGWAQLPAAADRQGVTLQLQACAGLLGGVPPEVDADLRDRERRHRAAHLRALVALERLAPLLDEAAEQWLVFKGPVLSDHVYGQSGRRSFADLDVLIRPAQVSATVAALEAGGAQLVTRNWRLIREDGVAELTYVLPNGTALDLHWDLIGTPGDCPDIRLDSAGALTRRRTITIGARVGAPMQVPALAPIDQLLHLVVHAVLSGMGPLRFCLDVDQVTRHDAPELTELLAAAEASGARPSLAIAVQRTVQTLGPNPVTSQLRAVLGRGGSWPSVIAAWSRIKPPSAAHEKAPSDFVICSTRARSTTSFRELGHKLADRGRAFRHPSAALHRMRTGSQDGTNLDPWMLDVDEGHRAALLRDLDAR